MTRRDGCRELKGIQTMGRNKLQLGVFGVGRIGKIHIGNLASRIPTAEVTILADVFPLELAAVAARFNVARTVSDYREALKLADLDAVVICTPTATHYQMILDAAAAGKHIFCEKPIDMSVDRIKQINAEVKKHGVQLMVGFNRRFDPNFLKVRELVKSGKIGEPQLLRITSRDPSAPSEEYLRASGGLFLDMTIHDFDMARYLAGSEVVEVYARANALTDPVFQKLNDWDTAVTTLTFANGALGTIDNSRKAVYGYDQRVEVFGSNGMATVKNNTPDNHVYLDAAGTHSALPLHFFMERYTESYLNEMQAFVDSVQNGTPVPVTGHDGLMAVAIGLAAAKSVRENRAIKPGEVS
ncbi:MAG TPA: inositol 2-dehydrogenase [Bryobacteraceae bacterium]|nr:inositol 2-dehydrogenase [Bryobacteraceae bacterium]